MSAFPSPFIGTGKRLNQGDIGNAARQIGIPTAALLAFLETESSGHGFDGLNRPLILTEPHRFYAELGAGKKRNTAVARHLAYKKWGTEPYPRTSSANYKRLEAMGTIDQVCALKATSWGMPQIMGSEHKLAGYSSPGAMVTAMMKGEPEQLQCLVGVMRAYGIAKKLAGRDLTKPDSWRDAVKAYNGPGYAKNNYHVKCAKAFVKHSGPDAAKLQIPTASTSMLELGMKGEAVRNLQADLKALGYQIVVDGQFGPKTRDIVEAFQARHLLSVDGRVGNLTRAALDRELKTANPKAGKVTRPADGQTLGALIGRLLAAFFAAVFKKRS